MRLAAALFVVLVVASEASAQDNPCPPEAFKNFDASQSSTAYRLSYLRSVDRETFEILKRERRGSGGFSIAGVDLSARADFEEFESKRSRELSRFSYNEESANALNYVRNSFDGPGSAAYNSCVRAQSANRRGLFVWLNDPTAEGVTVTILWRPSAGQEPATFNVDSHVQIAGSTSPTTILNGVWDPDSFHSFIASRDRSKDFRFLVNFKGESASVFIPKEPAFVQPGTAPPVSGCLNAEVISLNKPVRVGAISGGDARRITDGRIVRDIAWTANARAPQWVEIDLQGEMRVTEIRLVTSQNGRGMVEHLVFGINAAGLETLLCTARKAAENFDTLIVDVPAAAQAGIRKVKVRTVESPFHVSWVEIQVRGCPNGSF